MWVCVTKTWLIFKRSLADSFDKSPKSNSKALFSKMNGIKRPGSEKESFINFG